MAPPEDQSPNAAPEPAASPPPATEAAKAAPEASPASANIPEGTPSPAAVPQGEEATPSSGAAVDSVGAPVTSADAIPPTDETKMHAKGRPVLYRAKTGAEQGEDAERLHHAIITRLHDDWTADLTVFPNGRAIFHAHKAKLAATPHPYDLSPGEWIGNG